VPLGLDEQREQTLTVKIGSVSKVMNEARFRRATTDVFVFLDYY